MNDSYSYFEYAHCSLERIILVSLLFYDIIIIMIDKQENSAQLRVKLDDIKYGRTMLGWKLLADTSFELRSYLVKLFILPVGWSVANISDGGPPWQIGACYRESN